MTTTHIPSRPLRAEAPTWTHVEPLLWVASTRQEFLGTVEKIDGRYVACDRHTMPIASFGDLESAKRRVLWSAAAGAAGRAS